MTTEMTALYPFPPTSQLIPSGLVVFNYMRGDDSVARYDVGHAAWVAGGILYQMAAAAGVPVQPERRLLTAAPGDIADMYPWLWQDRQAIKALGKVIEDAQKPEMPLSMTAALDWRSLAVFLLDLAAKLLREGK